MNVERDRFYDPSRVAIMAMGFCYPGVLPNGGDKPPRPECAPLWHARFLRLMPDVRLTLLVGRHAQAFYLGPEKMSDHVANFAAHSNRFALPHPSWRTIAWERRNPWFGEMVLPALRAALAELLQS
jgi:uracil-DNA glycosylase